MREQRFKRCMDMPFYEEHAPFAVVAEILEAADGKRQRLRIVNIIQAGDERASGIL